MTHEAIIEMQRAETRVRLRGEARVLLVQDTTSFNFSHHPATQGLGPLENKHCRGFLAHTTLAVSEAGVPLGVMHQQVWARRDEAGGTRHRRHERAFEDKESYKWVKGVPLAEASESRQQTIIVCDAEAHIYDFLNEMVVQELDFIVRAADARSVTTDGASLFEALAQQPWQQQFTLPLKRHPEREARDAAMELRFTAVTLKRPARSAAPQATLRLWAVDVIEPNPPAGEEAIHWVLLTSLPLETVAQAQQIVRWYTFRWLVERFHFVLKSGCKLEESQLRAADRLERLLAVYSVVAWRLLWLTYQARQTPDVPCTVALKALEWQALFAFVQRTAAVPETAPTLRQAVRWIAHLGGFLGRTGDGEPGVKVLWRGWTRLQDLVDMWSVLHPLSKDVGNA